MISLILLIVAIVLGKKFNKKIPKKIIKIVIVIEVIGIVVTVGEYLFSNVLFNNKLERPEIGSKDIEEEMQYSYDDVKEDVVIKVPAKTYSKDEQEGYIDKAIEEIEQTFLGDNESLDEVSFPVVMNDKYVDDKVSAEWNISDYKVIGPSGDINYEEVIKEKIINADVTLMCEDTTKIHSFSFKVIPLEPSSPQGIKLYINEMLKKLLPDDNEISLPNKISNKEITWSKKYTYIGTKIGILGFLGAMAMMFGERIEKKNKKKKNLKMLERDYPKIVESIALYVGAGLSIKNALFRISKEYMRRRKMRIEPGYEGILLVCKEIEEGKSEQLAYMDLPMFCEAKEYKRLSNLLVRNLKKGTKGMIEQLEKEEEISFEMQKQSIKVLGEEASTKMLIPLIGLLGIVLVIIICPAIFNMQL